MPTHTLAITWEQFHRDARNLALKLHENKLAFSHILAITKGGLIPAMIIGRELGINDIRTIGVRSYGIGSLEEETKRGGVVITSEPSQADLAGFPLVVDDLIDSGSTINAVNTKIRDLTFDRTPRPYVVYAVIYGKGRYPKMPNFFYGVDHHPDAWLLMPWDMAPQFQLPLTCKLDKIKNG